MAHTAHWGFTAQNSLLKQIYGEDRTLEEIGMLAIVPPSIHAATLDKDHI